MIVIAMPFQLSIHVHGVVIVTGVADETKPVIPSHRYVTTVIPIQVLAEKSYCTQVLKQHCFRFKWTTVPVLYPDDESADANVRGSNIRCHCGDEQLPLLV